MASKHPTYKTLRNMLEDLDSGKEFNKRLQGRCFTEAFFEDIESLLSLNSSKERFMTVSSEANYRDGSFVRRYPMAIAASLALILVTVYFSVRLTFPNVVETDFGQFKRVELPDHSNITLNAKSEVVYNPISWYWDRKVTLKGEAFFEVEKGSKFTVETEAGNVTVLGTSFNVKQRDLNFDVVCKTGKVKVESGANTVILNPNEKSSLLVNGALSKLKEQNYQVATWKEGYFYFDASSLAEVMNDLERQYGVNIKIGTNKDFQFSGYFAIKDLDNSLKTVCTALGLNYRAIQNSNNKTEIIIE